ncbi:heavy metal-binding domain-containing protein [[Eubacterium] cellulosolvens]
MTYCPKCGKQTSKDEKFCLKCGSPLQTEVNFLIVTTPTIPGYQIEKVLGVVTGLTPRTRGVLGKFIASFQSMVGGEVTAFTSELEKARLEAIERIRQKAASMGANAIIGLDLETSDLGLQAGVVVISATGTAVIANPVKSPIHSSRKGSFKSRKA